MAKVDENLLDIGERAAGELGESLNAWHVNNGDLVLTATRDNLRKVIRFLRDDPACQFTCFIDLCGVDYPGRPERFEVVYHFLSPTQNARVRIKTTCADGDVVPSICDLFPGANWCEREAFDLYGIRFGDHPDLRRILTDYGFEGHPLRKDFPLTGHVEVRYSDAEKQVVYGPVKLTQEFRNFDYESPWEGGHYQLPGDEKANAG